MEIKTRLSIDDEVFYLKNNAVKQATIRSIDINVTKDINILYKTKCADVINEKFAFKTKQELLDSL